MDYDSLHPILKPYVDAYIEWKAISGVEKWDYIEQEITHSKYHYQGRFDRASIRDGILADLKCGPDEHPSIGLQLAAYEGVLQGRRGVRGKLHRLSIHLLPNGRFKVHEWKDRADFPLFLGMLNIHQWRIKHGLYRESRD